MTHHITLAACLTTIAVVVPAGWHSLGANIQTDGKRLRPLQQVFTVDDVKVTLDVDRSVIMTGDTVKATLVAFSDAPKQVVVDLTALHSTNYEGARVEMPWIPIDHETLKLTSAPHGGKAVETTIKLGERPSAPALADDFKIYVSAHGKKPPKQEYEAGLDYQVGVSEGYAAAVLVTGWSGNNLGLKIEPSGPLTSDAPFEIAVRVKNTTGHELSRAPWISLTTEAALAGSEEDGHEAIVAIDQIDDDKPADSEDEDRAFKRGAEEVARFRVTPNKKGLGKVTFLASAFEMDEMPGPTTAGAKDARTFALSDSPAQPVAVK
jgi:hypothetical protein